MIHACSHNQLYDITVQPKFSMTKQSIQTASELQKKIRLEKIFAREIRPLFNQILRDYQANIRAFGRAQDASRYTAQWKGLLVTHYDRTQRAFRGAVIGEVVGKHMVSYLTKQSPERVASLVDIALLNWRDTQSDLVADIITDTNQEQMDRNIERARQELIDQEIAITPVTLSLASSALLHRQFKVRTNTIAQTETQTPAENTKATEASVAAGRAPDSLEPEFAEPVEERVEVDKQWVTIGDGRVRPSHVATNGITIPEKALFTVGGDLLKYPGDNSQGASPAQFINCRCSADYFIRRG